MQAEIDIKIIERIKKLLALASNNPNEAEASSAMAKASALLEEHNLDMANLGMSGKGAQRSDTTKGGGLYKWQRGLWDGVAKLNFCHYLSIRGLKAGSNYEHRLIGSHANVISTEIMANYLQQTIEKLAQQWAKDNFYKSVFVKEAIAYREGMAARIIEKLAARRREVVSEAREAAEEKKQAEARTGVVTGNALTILDVISTEDDLNNDYLNGWELGTTARHRAETEANHRAWREQWKKEQEERDRLEEQFPHLKAERLAREKEQLDGWAKEEAKRAARRNKTPPKPRYRKETPEEARRALGSYWDGYSKGREVGIDPQMDKSRQRVIG